MLAVTIAVEGEYLRRHSIKEKPIMTDGDDGSLIRFQRFFERFARRNIEMIRRLVEHQDIDARINQLCERESSLLSTGQIAHVLVNVIAKEKKFCQKRSQFADC